MTPTFKHRFYDFGATYRSVEAETDAAVKRVLASGEVIMGPDVTALEAAISARIGDVPAVAVANGTDALILALHAAGVGPGDEVITVAYTYLATIAAIVHVGAKPVLVDVRDDDMLMDPTLIERAITPRTKAILPVHLYGRVCDMPAIMEIANRRKLVVIEDNAQGFGASIDGRPAGSWGHLSCLSFFPGKTLGAFGDGGMVQARGEEHLVKLRLLRDHGRIPGKLEFACFGFNSRLDSLQAAILLVKLKHMDAWIARRRELSAAYDRHLARLPLVQRPLQSDARHFDNGYCYALRVDDRNALVAHLRGAGVEAMPTFPLCVTRFPALGLSDVKLPVTERINDRVLVVPLRPELTVDDVGEISEVVAAFYRART